MVRTEVKISMKMKYSACLYFKMGFFFWISTLISVTAEQWSYTSDLFFTPVRQIIVL
jgi:hypothetical protein